MMTMRVLVIGAGIGGLALAQALRRSDIDVAVFERGAAADDWPTGYRIHVNTSGTRALEASLPEALFEQFCAASAQPGEGLGFVTEHLRTLLMQPFVIAPRRTPDQPRRAAQHSAERPRRRGRLQQAPDRLSR